LPPGLAAGSLNLTARFGCSGSGSPVGQVTHYSLMEDVLIDRDAKDIIPEFYFSDPDTFCIEQCCFGHSFSSFPAIAPNF